MSDVDKTEALRLLDVSRETAGMLEAHVELLRKWTPKINLISRATLPVLWSRHVLDSAQLLDLMPKGASRWLDLGSGGGFPGIVIAILAAERHPALRVTLVDSDLRKAAFLQTVVRELGLSAEVSAERSESLPPSAADVVSARAMAPLMVLLTHARRHLAPGGVALFPKGAGHDIEVAEALERWRFSVHKTPSRTDPRAVILSVGDIASA